MFTLPPWPPKDYKLLSVPKAQQSSSVITPLSLPRSTQTNIGKYLYPVSYKDSEKVKPEIKKVHPTIVEKSLQKSRAWWVDKPSLVDFNNIVKFAESDSNNPVYQHKEKVFNRPLHFEADCREFLRLKKLQDKSDKESEAKCRYTTGLQQAQIIKQSEEEALNVSLCQLSPPFWWKDKTQADQTYTTGETENSNILEDIEKVPRFWQEPLSPNQAVVDDPCLRRKELLMVGLPFRNECCNWYYNNYPPPKITFRPQRFGK